MKRHSGRRNKRRSGNTDIPLNKKVDIFTQSCTLVNAPKIHRFVLKSNYALINSIIGSAAGNTAGSFIFNLGACANSTSLQGLFDQFLIETVDITFRPRTNAFTGSAGISSPPLYVVIDYDSSTALVSGSAATEYSNCVILEAYESLRRVFKPRFAVPAYQAGAFSAYKNSTGWIDCAYPNTEHYGVKWFLPTCNASFIPEWDLDCNITFLFRNTI
jgi:hypothetical protein